MKPIVGFKRNTLRVSLQLRHWMSGVGCRALNGCKKPLLLAIAILLSASIHAAEGPTFDQANRLYEEGKFRDAVEAYSQLIASGTRSAALFFNLGNAQFKAGRVGEAIASYRQAEQLAPRDPDVRANLAFARRQVTGPTLRPGWFHARMETLTTNEWTLLAVLPVWGWFGLLILPRLKPGLRSSLRTATWVGGLVSLCACAAFTYVLSHRLNEHTLVVTERNAVVRYGPFSESQSAFTAADGAELSLLDHKDDWYQVSDGGKTVGWIKTNAVVLLR